MNKKSRIGTKKLISIGHVIVILIIIFILIKKWL